MSAYLLLCLTWFAGSQSGARSAQDWWSEGTRLYDADQYAAAAKAFAQLTARQPESGPAHAMLGLCESKLGQFDDALKHIEKSRRLGLLKDPSFRNVVTYHYGLLLLEKGRFEDGQKVLDGLAHDTADSDELRHALGCAVLRFRPSHVSPADASANQLIKAAGQAEILSSRNDNADAQRAYQQLAAEYGKQQNVQYAYGRFLLTQRENDRAIAAFKQELGNTPGHVLARLAIADTLRSSDPAASLPFAEAAVRLAPALPTAHYVLGMSLLDNRRATEAIHELEAARQELPDQARIYYALARAYSSLGRKEDAARASQAFARLRAAEQGSGRP